MKSFLLATLFFIHLSGCSLFSDSSISQLQEDLIHLECYRPKTNELQEWTMKLDIDIKNNTVDSYSQKDNFFEPNRFPSEFVSITNRFIKFDTYIKGKVSFGEINSIDRQTGNYYSAFIANDVEVISYEYKCKKIRTKNLF